jgi:hypothetical protein
MITGLPNLNARCPLKTAEPTRVKSESYFLQRSFTSISAAVLLYHCPFQVFSIPATA